jgi:hypothetical protein
LGAVNYFREGKRTLHNVIGMEAIEELRKRLPNIKAPLGGEKVYKDECAFSFDNPVRSV